MTEFSKILPLNILLLALAVYIVSLIFKKCLADQFKTNKLLKRLYPLFPLLLSIGISFVPGVFPDLSWGVKLLNGCLACFAAVYLHHLIKKTAFGDVSVEEILVEEEKPVEKLEDESPKETDEK